MSYNGYRKGHWISTALTAVLLLLLVAGAAFFFLGDRILPAKKPRAAENTPTAVVEIEKIVSGDAIQEKLRAVGELTSEEYAYAETGSYETRKAAELFGQGAKVPTTRANFFYRYEGVIRAGVDFSEARVEKDDTLKSIAVYLPKAKILNSELAAGDFSVYNEKTNTFDPIGVEAAAEQVAALREEAETRAVENGLLDRADENARDLVEAMIGSAYSADGYAIRVETAK